MRLPATARSIGFGPFQVDRLTQRGLEGRKNRAGQVRVPAELVRSHQLPPEGAVSRGTAGAPAPATLIVVARHSKMAST